MGVLLALSCAAQPVRTDPPLVPAANLVPATMLSGPLFSLASIVPVHNYLGQFQLQSNYGVFSVSGRRMLAVRESELAAIQALEQVNHTDAFQQALTQAAAAPVQLVHSALNNPTATVENIASGFGTILGRIGRVAEMGANAVADKASDLSNGSAQSPAAPAPAEVAGEPMPPRFIGDPFGYNKARREWAKKLDIDPYTTNPVLRPKLDQAAAASFAGSFAVDTAIGLVAAPLQYAVEFDNTVRDAVWNLPAIDLESRNQSRLASMGIDGRVVRDFFRNRWFTPTLQTALVTALEQFPSVAGRESVIRNATTVQGEVRARALINGLRALAAHQSTRERFNAITASGVLAVGTTTRGERVVAADLDYVWWNATAAEFARRPGLSEKRKTLLVTGAVDDDARRGLERTGWRGGEPGDDPVGTLSAMRPTTRRPHPRRRLSRGPACAARRAPRRTRCRC